MDTELVLVYAGRAHYLGTCKSFVFILSFFHVEGLVFFVWVCWFFMRGPLYSFVQPGSWGPLGTIFSHCAVLLRVVRGRWLSCGAGVLLCGAGVSHLDISHYF